MRVVLVVVQMLMSDEDDGFVICVRAFTYHHMNQPEAQLVSKRLTDEYI